MGESWQIWAAPLINGAALLLAIAFHRNRAAIVLVILVTASLALVGVGTSVMPERGIEALRMFAPCLLLAAAVMPERRLMARRNLAILGLLVISAGLTMAVSAQFWAGLREAFPLGWLPWRAGSIAAGIVVLGAGACLIRWGVLRAPIEAALGLILLLTAIAMLPVMRARAASELLAIAGATAVLAILFASYRMAFVDGLAGVPNRRALDDALARLSGDFAIAMIDVDFFKKFNDRHGHAAGDRVLKAVAEQLTATREAQAYRYGGEEFSLLFTGKRVVQAKQICEELCTRVAAMRVPIRSAPGRSRKQPAKGKDRSEVRITVSIGLAERSERMRSADDVLKAADKALYSAKAKGRNRVVAP